MPEVRLKISGEDNVSPEVKKMTKSLDEAEAAVTRVSKAGKENTKTFEQSVHMFNQTEMGVRMLTADVFDLFNSMERLGIITEEQSESLQKLQDVMRMCTSSLEVFTDISKIYNSVSKALAVQNKVVETGMTGVAATTGTAATSMGLLAAKIGLVVGAGIALGVVFSTIILGLVRMIKLGEGAGEAFKKSFEFSIGSIKKFGSEIGELVTSLGGASDAEGEFDDRVKEITRSLEGQRDVVKKKTETNGQFAYACKEAGASEEQLKQAVDEGRITFEKQKEAVEKSTESIKENKETVEDFLSTQEKARINELNLGTSAEESAKKIAMQEKVVRGKLEPMDQYKKKLMDIFKNEEIVNDIIEKGIWPWEKQKKALESNTVAVAGYEQKIKAAKIGAKTEEPAEDEWIKNVLKYLEDIQKEKERGLQTEKEENSLLKERVSLLDQLLDRQRRLIEMGRAGRESAKRVIAEAQSQASAMEWEVGA